MLKFAPQTPQICSPNTQILTHFWALFSDFFSLFFHFFEHFFTPSKQWNLVAFRSSRFLDPKAGGFLCPGTLQNTPLLPLKKRGPSISKKWRFFTPNFVTFFPLFFRVFFRFFLEISRFLTPKAGGFLRPGHFVKFSRFFPFFSRFFSLFLCFFRVFLCFDPLPKPPKSEITEKAYFLVFCPLFCACTPSFRPSETPPPRISL